MAEIQRAAGNVPARCWGSAWRDLVRALGVSGDFDLAFREQAVRAFVNLAKALAQAGAGKARILSAAVILADIDGKPVLDQLWADRVGDDPRAWPRRACHGASLEPKVQIEDLTARRARRAGVTAPPRTSMLDALVSPAASRARGSRPRRRD